MLVDWAPHPDEGDKLLFVFNGDVNGQALTRDPAEMSEAKYVEVAAFPDFLNERLRTRLTSAAQDRPDAYTEFGV